jgi:putative ABC transport system permease protein
MVQNPNVMSVTLSTHHLGKSDAITTVHLADRDYEVQQLAVDALYFTTMELPLKEGRVFKERAENDKQTVVVNELLVKEMGWSQPVGQLLEINQKKFEVIGVVKDFHHRSFYYEIRPTIFTVANPEGYRYISMRVHPGSEKETYASLQVQWAKLFPETPFDGNYQQDVWGIFFEQLYTQEKFSRVIAIVAVLLASLGLYGLVTLNVSGRTREFSIRKVLGASIGNLANNIIHRYILLALAAMLVGAPVSYMLIRGLLQMMYAYPLPMGLSGVSISVVILLFVLLAVVSTQILKVLKANPVQGLKSE